MKIPSRPRQSGLRFNVTPLIDIVFLLIIFFLAASHFARSETLESVNLPEATQEEEEQDAQRLVITITEDRLIHVASTIVDRSAVEALIMVGRIEALEAGEIFEVRIRADEDVPYSEIEPIMLACARAGISNVKFAVNLE